VRGFSALSVLVVDDSRHMRELAKALLRGYGFTTIHDANSVQTALPRFQDCRHDLVIVDFDMPGLGGVALIEHIRRDRVSFETGIILMTAFADRTRVYAARDSGASEIIVKPLSTKSLLERINVVIDHPRPFVRAAHYAGPDRRRRTDHAYDGPLRRAGDSEIFDLDAPHVAVRR